MSKKHYEAIAKAISEVMVRNKGKFAEQVGAIEVAKELATVFANDNPRFNRARFLHAAAAD